MNDWVTIQRFTYPQEASIAQAKLESMGIETFLQDELTTQVVGIYSHAIGGARLQVPRGKQEEAKKILIEGGFLKDETLHNLNSAAYPDKTICPFCGSDDIDSMEKPPILSVVFYYLSRFVFMIGKDDHCNACNKYWRYKKTA